MAKPLDEAELARLERPSPFVKAHDNEGARARRRNDPAAVRREWLRRLRQEGERQCVGLARRAYRSRHPDRELWFAHHVCAMALLGEVTEGPAWFLRHPDGIHFVGPVRRSLLEVRLASGRIAGLALERKQLGAGACVPLLKVGNALLDWRARAVVTFSGRRWAFPTP